MFEENGDVKYSVNDSIKDSDDEALKRAYQLQYIEKAPATSVRVQGESFSSLTNTASVLDSVSYLHSLDKRYEMKNF